MSSQQFLEDLKNIPEEQPTHSQSVVVENGLEAIVTRNDDICSQYVQLKSNLNDSFDRLFVGCASDITEKETNFVLSATVVAEMNDENDFTLIEDLKRKSLPTVSTPTVTKTSSRSLLQDFFDQKTDSVFEICEKIGNRPALRPVSSNLFCELGKFYGLPMKVKQLIKEYKNIDELYDWQHECLNLHAVHQRNNLIYALPTSGGKSLVSEILMMREVLCRKKNVLLILPFNSLVQEKIADLTPFALEMGYLIEEYAAGKGAIPPIKRRSKNTIFICTIEKSLILFDSLIQEERATEIGLIVVDEFHIIGDKSRGYVLEQLLTKSMFMYGRNIQIVGEFSVEILNFHQITEFSLQECQLRSQISQKWQFFSSPTSTPKNSVQ